MEAAQKGPDARRRGTPGVRRTWCVRRSDEGPRQRRRWVVFSGPLPDAPLEAHTEQLLRLDGELHGQLAEDLLAEAPDDQRDRVLHGDAAEILDLYDSG